MDEILVIYKMSKCKALLSTRGQQTPKSTVMNNNNNKYKNVHRLMPASLLSPLATRHIPFCLKSQQLNKRPDVMSGPLQGGKTSVMKSTLTLAIYLCCNKNYFKGGTLYVHAF